MSEKNKYFNSLAALTDSGFEEITVDKSSLGVLLEIGGRSYVLGASGAARLALTLAEQCRQEVSDTGYWLAAIPESEEGDG